MDERRRPHTPPALERRRRDLQRLGAEQFDVLVIGGGITGAGVALDAASRGYRTALIDKGDFASGTSSKSSKLIHGGLRYLQQRELRLVYENLAERQRLLDNAPHLVSPLPFLIPLFGHDGAVSRTVARSYQSALWLYDLTGGVRIGARHRKMSKSDVLAHFPGLGVDHLVAGFLYFDARADDARLTLTVLQTAIDHGAIAANYVAAIELLEEPGGRVIGVRARPAPFATGGGDAGSDSHAPIDIGARVVVNAAGVWSEQVETLGGGENTHSIRPAKGVHVTVPARRMAADIAAVIPVPKDRRSIFVVPWPEVGLVYLGTTDTDYDGPLDDPACTPEDVDYILTAANGVTGAALTRDDVTAVWAGLRPLLSQTAGAPALSQRTADLSRRHAVTRTPGGLVSVTGGKLTTYRKMAEDTVDQVVDVLGDARRERPCATRRLPLHGSPALGPLSGTRPGAGDPGVGVSPARSIDGDPGVRAHLADRYGTAAGTVLALGADRPDLLRPVVEGLPYLGVEVVYAVRAEMALTLDDVLARRTRARIQDARAAAAAAGPVGRLVGAELGWSEDESDEQARGFRQRALGELEEAGVGTGVGSSR